MTGGGADERIELLKQAIQLIKQAKFSLDLHEEACNTCGLHVYRNRQDWQANMELEAVQKKLQKWIEKLT